MIQSVSQSVCPSVRSSVTKWVFEMFIQLKKTLIYNLGNKIDLLAKSALLSSFKHKVGHFEFGENSYKDD